jgi:hypothetical protein
MLPLCTSIPVPPPLELTAMQVPSDIRKYPVGLTGHSTRPPSLAPDEDGDSETAMIGRETVGHQS